MSDIFEWKGKQQVTGDIGEKLDQQLSNAEAEVASKCGGKDWLKMAAVTTIPSIHKRIDADFEAGKFDPGKLDELQLKAQIKQYVTMVSEGLLNLSKKAESEQFIGAGKVVALKGALELVSNHHNVASSRLKQVQAAAEEPPPDKKARKRATRPKSSLDDRREEAQKEKAQAQKAPKKNERKKRKS